jgi:hypothetical protein
MKIKNILKLLFLVLMVLLTDCKKDDPENYFTYDGKTYSLAGGVLSNGMHDIMSGGYNFILTLYSSGLTYDSGNDKVTGSGELMFFLVSSYTAELQSKTYSYNSTSNANAPGTYSGCWLKHNLITSANTSTNVELYTGTLGVFGTASSVSSISINIKTRDGKSVTGYYKGPLEKN